MGNTCSNKKSTTVTVGKKDPVKSEVKVNAPEKDTKVDSLAGRPPWNPSVVVDPPPRRRRELEDDPTYAPSAQKNKAKDQEKPGSPEEDSKKKISPEGASKCGCC